MTVPTNFQQNSVNKLKICRLCSDETEFGQLLFNYKHEIQELAQKICSCISVKLQFNQIYPNWLCPGCHFKLEATNQFFNLIRKGQKNITKKFGTLSKRGRKPKIKNKTQVVQKKKEENIELKDNVNIIENDTPKPKRKRNKKTPGRFQDSMQGNELENLYSEFGISRRRNKNSKAKEIANINSENGEIQAVQNNDEKYKCSTCEKYFINQFSFFEHLSTHTNILYECTECQGKFPSKLMFDEHINLTNHVGLDIVETPCEKPLNEDLKDTENEKDIPNEELSQLDIVETPCEKSLNADVKHTENEKHIPNEELSQSQKLFACSKCSKSFATNNSLKRHQQTHSQNRPYKCDICPSAFKRRSLLSVHKTGHRNERTHKCPKCPKSFVFKQTLKIHLRIHDGLKPYECSICQKSFTQPGNLKEHKRIHTGERPFVCLICGTAFKTSSQCRFHQRSHTSLESPAQKYKQVKTHECKVCGKLFDRRSPMMKHLRIHTGEKPYACHLCPKKFSDPSNFKKHKIQHTKKSEKSPQVEQVSLLKQNHVQRSINQDLDSLEDPDPDPDGLLPTSSLLSDLYVPPPNHSIMELLNEDNDNGTKPWGLLHDDSDPIITEISKDDFSFVQQQHSLANQLVCISYPDPLNPVSNKTTFYVVN